MYRTTIPTLGRIGRGAAKMGVRPDNLLPTAVDSVVSGAEELAETGNPLTALGATAMSFGGGVVGGALAGKYAPRLAEALGRDPERFTNMASQIAQSIGTVGGESVVANVSDYFANQGGQAHAGRNARKQFNLNRIARQVEQHSLNRRSVENLQQLYDSLGTEDEQDLE